MPSQVTCTFKVPETLNNVVIELQGQKILFSDIMDPNNASIRTSSLTENDADEITHAPLSVRQCKAALVHYYRNSVLPEIDHPDKESDNFFYTWMLVALPHKIPEWNVEDWRAAFRH